MNPLVNLLEIKFFTFLFPFALIALFYGIALSRCWFASVDWRLRGKDLMENDEIQTLNRLENTRVTVPMVDTEEADPIHDEYIENLLQTGRFLQAKDYVRDMRSLAREQLDQETARYYELYDRRISRLQARNFTLSRQTA